VISKSVKPFTVTTSITTGVAQHIKTVGIARIFLLTTAGVAAGGDNVGYSWTAGGAVAIPIGKKGWAVVPMVRVIKSSLTDFQGIYGVNVGWGK
jgi:hypothetical protein